MQIQAESSAPGKSDLRTQFSPTQSADTYPFDLGSHSRTIVTTSPEAHRWFNLGLNWCLGFNQEEGVKCFRNALAFDPNCVMAHWGVAYGSGPFYNLIWRDLGELEADHVTNLAFHHVQRALALSEGREGCRTAFGRGARKAVSKTPPRRTRAIRSLGRRLCRRDAAGPLCVS